MIEDRSMQIEPGSIVRTAWVPIDDCVLGNRERMDVAAIERSFRRYLQAGDCQFWPPIVGHWSGARFVVCDGRHELLALMALGRESVFVAWVGKAEVSALPQIPIQTETMWRFPVPHGTATFVVNALDAKSFTDHAEDIADSLSRAMREDPAIHESI